MLHGWTNGTFRAMDGVSGALGGTGFLLLPIYALFTFLYDRFLMNMGFLAMRDGYGLCCPWEDSGTHGIGSWYGLLRR